MPQSRTTRCTTQGNPAGRWFCWIMAGLLCLSGPARVNADTVTLNSGEVLEGRILSETGEQIEMEVAKFHGTILTKTTVAKADIKSIVRETLAEKQEKAATAALAKFTLNPNQELTTNQYAAGIATFGSFLKKYPGSSVAGDVSNRLAEWRAEVSNVNTGKVKFAGKWMTPDEKKQLAEQAQRQAEADASQNAARSLKTLLTYLQTQRNAVAESTGAIQAKLTTAQSKLAALKDTAASSGGTTVGADRPGLAGQLTQKIHVPSQAEAEQGSKPNPERAQLQNEISGYQLQISQGQAAISTLDAKIQEIQSQLPKVEQDSKSAQERAAEPPGGAKTNEVTRKVSPPTVEPPLPWYSRAWKWVSSFWH